MAYVIKKGDTSKPNASTAVLRVPKGSSAKPSISKLPYTGTRRSPTKLKAKSTAKKKLY